MNVCKQPINAYKYVVSLTEKERELLISEIADLPSRPTVYEFWEALKHPHSPDARQE